ncbi:MAG: TonB-dependent receptor plug domain-containing protein, partial [Campylobacterales bacterium]
MRKILLPSLYASLLVAGPITIETVTVSAESETKPAALSAEEIKFTRQSDLGEILSQTIPSIQAVRASAVGTDITVRGFKRDDVTVTIDDAKVCGACPNRMDPPAMHVSSAQIERVEVQEGPFNVRHSGSMGGSVEIDTKKPKPGLEAELSATVGSFGYQKYGVTVNGGNQKLRAIAGYSYETSDQYEDGDGKTMSQQV